MGNILIAGFGSAVDLDVVTAEAGDIVAGKVIVDKNGNPLTGTLSLSGNTETGDVRKGKTFYSTNPKSKQTGTMAEKDAATYTPGTSNQVISANQYLTGAQTILGDPQLIASNIKHDINIFGVTGNLQVASMQRSNIRSSTSTKAFKNLDQVTRNKYYVTVSISTGKILGTFGVCNSEYGYMYGVGYNGETVWECYGTRDECNWYDPNASYSGIVKNDKSIQIPVTPSNGLFEMTVFVAL